MVDILTQKFTYATITLYKDYCKLSDRRNHINKINDSLDILDEDDHDIFTIKSVIRSENHPKTGKIFCLPEKKKKKLNYFTTNEKIQERFSLDYSYINNKTKRTTYETTKNQQIRRHYGRPFSEIIVYNIERSIRLHGDKLTIKLYTQTKQRNFNCIYFRKRFDVHSLTINLKTGNFTTATISKSGNINTKSFRTNSFRLLMMLFGKSFFDARGSINKDSRLIHDFLKVFDDVLFTTKIQELLNIKMGHTSYSVNPNAFIDDFIKKFIELKKIKIPNGDVSYWITNFYPTEKYLKKNDRKLVASILDMFKIKSKSTIKILHEYPNLNLLGFVKFCSYFGSDYSKYIANISQTTFINSYKIRGKEIDFNNNKFTTTYDIKNRYYLSSIEKENLVKIANSKSIVPSGGIMSDRFTQLLDDHFKMIERIREYDSDIHMKARNMDEFDNEHTELSKIISAINKGWVIEYKFSEKMTMDIEKPIPLKINLGTEEEPLFGDDLGISFYPIVLKREEEYIEEGKFMHHCVASYADKDKSIIISVRTEDKTDRVTCEFDCQTGNLIQARHFCNRVPPADIEYVIINDLSPKVKKYARLGLLHASEKLKVPVKINGVEVKKTEPTRFGFEQFFEF
jgi:hypothetical protein